MNKNLSKYKSVRSVIKLFTVLAILGFHAQLLSQVLPKEDQKIFTDTTGNIFANRHLELYLFISEEISNNKLLLEATPNTANTIKFNRHGMHSFVHIDPITNQQTTYEIFADGVAPNTEIKFSKGLVMKYENRYYCQEEAAIYFNASDANSGVNSTYLSIDKVDYKKWDGKSLSIIEKPQFELAYYSVDNVGNIEKPQVAYIYFDTESIIELEEIFFDHNRADLTSESMRQLDELVKALKEFPELRIMLMSHTDSRGTASYNLRLSKQRAESVKSYLVSKGIQGNRLEAVGYGDTMIRNECITGVDCSDEKHKVNRRTEFKILPFNK